MTASYCSVLIITFLTLLVLAALVRSNGRLQKVEKFRFYHICLLISTAALWEWLAIFLNGAPDWTIGLHKAVKCLDYIFTPTCSALFIRQVEPKGRRQKLVSGLLYGNAALEVVSAFTGWTFYVDARNYYHHGPVHFLYTVVFVAAILFVALAFLDYGRKYEKQNRLSLGAIFLLLLVTVVMQEISSEMRVAYLGMAIASCLLFIHYSEFKQVDQEAAVKRKDQELATDALTGVLSRFAYKQVTDSYSEKQKLPDWLAAFEVDVNGLKNVNDTAGHEAGDELLRATGSLLNRIIGNNGQVFRIGGDEFVILLDTRSMSIEQAEAGLRGASAEWKGVLAKEMSLSIGSVSVKELPGADVFALVHEADQRMYADKDRYYSIPGHDRRRGPYN